MIQRIQLNGKWHTVHEIAGNRPMACIFPMTGYVCLGHPSKPMEWQFDAYTLKQAARLVRAMRLPVQDDRCREIARFIIEEKPIYLR